ncbi:MAG TPA: tRNA (adenosine(37)-N6)-dimethylallyltransferase MiaA [Azoarcus taiwanensis]|nr:tRNA (adenosine(37)-N6)-dimethylallyltransferase MiaA [Azoarcus taiwanensis]
MSDKQATKPPALALLGPTASGKTGAALALAEHLPIEIISVDSALVYRDMDIGTAKPTHDELARCPHHLIDIISPEQSWSAAAFRSAALTLMDDITARGRIPLLVGGTMLYFKALRDGLSDLPRADAALRGKIDEDAAREGWPAMHARLAQLDPDAAARLEPTDAQRIQRALEIVLLTGLPVAENYARLEPKGLCHRLVMLGLAPSDRGVLHKRIEARLEQMFAAGFVGEVESLRARYQLSLDMPSMRCVGYRQVWSYLEGEDDFATMRFKAIVATRQLAKRQLTWQRQFRENWPELTELDCLDPKLPDRLLEAVAEHGKC